MTRNLVAPSHLPRFSVVRLSDGRVGRLENKPISPFVIVKGGHGVEVSRYDPLEVVRYPAELAREFVESYREQDAPPDVCPICGGRLAVDVEYMQDQFGPDWSDKPWPDWTFWCDDCGEAGLWAEFEEIVRRSRE